MDNNCAFCCRSEAEVITMYELGVKFVCDRCINALAQLLNLEGFDFCPDNRR
jgi:hypothetical protein